MVNFKLSNAISLTDIPFVYSVTNIAFIGITGIVEIEKFLIVGLFAGIFGTFLVFWHPIQWLITKLTLSQKTKLQQYFIKNKGHNPESLTIQIPEPLIRLSLNTSAIKYQKDKFTSLIYFLIILLTFSYFSTTDGFVQATQIVDKQILSVITIVPSILFVGVVIFLKNHFTRLDHNIKLNALYFLLTNEIIGYDTESNIIKTAIDLNDWDTVKEMIEKQMKKQWTNLERYNIKPK